jgi:hypothetical protein
MCKKVWEGPILKIAPVNLFLTRETTNPHQGIEFFYSPFHTQTFSYYIDNIPDMNFHELTNFSTCSLYNSLINLSQRELENMDTNWSCLIFTIRYTCGLLGGYGRDLRRHGFTYVRERRRKGGATGVWWTTCMPPPLHPLFI